MSVASTVLEDFVVVGVDLDSIQLRSGDGALLELARSKLSDVFDGVIRLAFRADAGSGTACIPIVLTALVSRDSDGQRFGVDVVQVKLGSG